MEHEEPQREAQRAAGAANNAGVNLGGINLNIQNIQGEHTRQRIQTLIQNINGQRYTNIINDLASLKRLAFINYTDIRVTAGGLQHALYKGQPYSLALDQHHNKHLLIRTGCKPSIYLEIITSTMLEGQPLTMIVTLDDYPTFCKTIEGLSYKYTINGERIRTREAKEALEITHNLQYQETRFRFISTRTFFIIQIDLAADETLSIVGNIDNWKMLWATQDQQPAIGMTILNKSNAYPITNQGPYFLTRGKNRGGRGARRRGGGRRNNRRQNNNNYNNNNNNRYRNNNRGRGGRRGRRRGGRRGY